MLHLPETLVYRLQPVTHEFERLSEPLFQSIMQFLVHRLAHLVELLLVTLLQLLDPRVKGEANAIQGALV